MNRTAVHEAGHAVILIRLGGKVESVDTIPAPTFTRGGVCRAADVHLDPDEIPSSNKAWVARENALWTVAGHFAEYKWGGGERRGSFLDGSDGDFNSLVKEEMESRWCRAYKKKDFQNSEYVKARNRFNGKQDRWRTNKEDKAAAKRVWNNSMRTLGRMVRKDDSIRRQVLAVAAELEVQERLTGAQVEETMRGAA